MINFYHIKDNIPKEKYKNFRTTTNSIHYYDSIIVLEKSVDLEKPIATVR